ncbi:hypothetical protein EIP86_000353 [Pleurotus ostreatoroseus]|nr:hypothetical protein EIP86_000353 [Pleurotus ostreatoroseus]
MSAPAVPKTMKALVTQSDKTAVVKEIPVPTIDDNEILVETVALAQNPTDWKFIKTVTRTGTICGCDWSGYVVQKGKDVTTLEIGDHVAGFVQGGTYTDRGAYAEYVKTTADLAWKIPAGTVSDEEAATYGCAFYTSAQALFHPTRLGLVEPPAKVEHEEWILIYGGSSSVGMFAVQLAKLAGYKIVSTSSPRNFELVKSLGADVVVDYNDPEAPKKIAEATGNTIHKAFDAISEASSQKIIIQAFAPGAGKIVATLPPNPEAQALRGDVLIQPTLIYTALGREFTLWGQPFPASVEDKQHMADFLTKAPEFVRTGAVKPNPTKLWEGGLEGIPGGLQYMMEGKNSGEKIIGQQELTDIWEGRFGNTVKSIDAISDALRDVLLAWHDDCGRSTSEKMVLLLQQDLPLRPPSLVALSGTEAWRAAFVSSTAQKLGFGAGIVDVVLYQRGLANDTYSKYQRRECGLQPDEVSDSEDTSDPSEGNLSFDDAEYDKDYDELAFCKESFGYTGPLKELRIERFGDLDGTLIRRTPFSRTAAYREFFQPRNGRDISHMENDEDEEPETCWDKDQN